MVNRRIQNVLMRVMAAVLSLSLLFGITSCDALMEEMLEAYESATGETSEESGQEETYESLEPTGSYTSSVKETKALDYDFIKSVYVYSVWYDVSTDNPADYDAVLTENAFALKGVFYFSEPLTTTFEAKLYRGDEVVLTKNVNMYDNVTCEADFSAGLEGLGTFIPGQYSVELLFEGKTVAKTDVMKVR